MLSDTAQTILHLSLISGIGPRTIEMIVRGLSSSDLLKEIYSFSISDFIARCGLSEKNARLVRDGLTDKKILDQECVLIKKHDISLCTIVDKEYPELLSHIHLPPSVLYYKGELPCKKTLAIVGSRAAGNYADQVTQHLVEGLVADGWAIVSGGAYGVDTMAHRKAIEFGATTVVVLGSGLLQPYPFSNKKLFDDVVKSGGVVISPFSLNTGPHRGNFPARNRIIAGLSKGCIVVQAGQKSGALITAHCALEEGRSVFAVPGPIDDPLSVGCHALLQQGAKLVQSVDDVLEEFGGVSVDKKHIHMTSKKPGRVPVLSSKKIQHDNPIVAALDIPRSLDDLSSRTGEPISDLQFKLFDLQIEGKIKQNFAGLWERV